MTVVKCATGDEDGTRNGGELGWSCAASRGIYKVIRNDSPDDRRAWRCSLSAVSPPN